MDSDDSDGTEPPSPGFSPVPKKKRDERSRSRSPPPFPIPDPPRPPPIPEPPIPIPMKTPETRTKAYPDGFAGPFVVYFRPIKKALNVARIAKDLVKHFPDVSLVEKVRPTKLRVTVASAKTANAITKSELFTLEYRVYIPSRDVEIDGVITEQSLTPEDVLSGEGRFKSSSLPGVKILDCKQMHSSSMTDGKKIFVPSDSYRVTFEGSALPDYVVIGMVRLPVRLFIPKVMNCQNCKQLGHTSAYCCNKARCEKCGEDHDGSCPSDTVKCVYCDDEPHELSTCPRYIQRKEKLKNSLKAKSRRTYAEMLKKSDPRPSTENSFALLSDNVEEEDPGEGTSTDPVRSGTKRSNSSSPKVPRKDPKIPQKDLKNPNLYTPKPAPPAPSPPGFKKKDSGYPPLPKPPKTPVPPPQSQTAMFSFSTIVKSILDLLNLPDPLRNIIETCIVPSVGSFLKSLTLNWPWLAAIISFDV